MMDGVRHGVRKASIIDVDVEPGVVAGVDGAPVLGLTGGTIVVEAIQPAGKAVMSGTAWLNGRRGAGGRIDPAEA